MGATNYFYDSRMFNSLTDPPEYSSTSYFYFGSDGDTFKLATDRTPPTSDAVGVKGEFCFDEDYMYRCVQTGTEGNAVWKRFAFSNSTW
jgi:hypothetical protein